jgi:uncharacterized damage-inducible protein DinB
MSVAGIYEGWTRSQAKLAGRLRSLTAQEVRLQASPEGRPIWAILAHIAIARVYWLCGVCGEAGAEATPFPDPLADGWEDQPEVARSPAEVLFAIESSWGIVESCLARWTPEMLGESFSRERNGRMELHSRASVLTRLVMHDAFHCGEASMILGMHGLPSMDPWEPVA